MEPATPPAPAPSPASANANATGAAYSADLQHAAQAMAWAALRRIAARIVPGMRESEAHALGLEELAKSGMELAWHPLVVRFGANTLRTFREASQGDPVLGEDDIFFLDLGPVYRGHEGDVGDTFVTGHDPDKHACAAAAWALFGDVKAIWAQGAVCGRDLYAAATRAAAALGWVLNLDVRGHRVGDYPHRIHHGGALGDLDGAAAPDMWILEIQLRHPTRAFGAFYEDLLG